MALNRIPLLRISVAFVLAMSVAVAASAADETKPVRMGDGIMTFDTVPGWGLLPDGHSALGPTHGGVAVDKEGNVYVSAIKGVVVFSPDGSVIRTFVGPQYKEIHDLKIRDE